MDVVVVGLGSMGSMALWRLAAARPDLRLLGIEQYGGVHFHGAYAGESRLFRVAAKEGRIYTPLLVRSRELWTELEQASGREILLKVGALSVGPAGHPDLDATLQSISDHDLPHETMDAAELRARYPQFHIEADDVGVLDVLGGGTRSEVGVLAATGEAIRLGAAARFGVQVDGIDVTSDGVRVATSEGDVLADRVVVTAGPWTTRVLPDLADLLTVSTYALTWFMPRHIERFTPDRFPGFMRDLGGVHAFGVPTLDGYSIKMCPQVDLDEVADIAARPPGLVREQLVWVGEQAVRMIPDLVPEAVRWSVHSDSKTAARMPVIDTVADGRIVVAAGMSGNGFKFAPVYGQALAEVILTGDSEWTRPQFTAASHREAAVPV
ncbi:FAD-dependent oxidoreductase [Propionicicella superfundia]|uniref:FAD-dependent oxidoreductase n=1 Tax=Propionicicella superfundia TaxID=348582 RepID=UPI00056A241D|nr:FAD-dependent oxidoreductase [Propionicicella superfundia]